MAKLTATLETAQGFSVLDKDNYPAHIYNVETRIREDSTSDFRAINLPEDLQHIQRYLDQKGAMMLAVQWKPEGDKAGDFIGTVFDNVMVAGYSGAKAKNPGQILSTDRLADYISALGVEWECKGCGVSTTSPFVREKGKAFCPSCGKAAGFDFDPDAWQGKRAMIQVDIGKDNKGKDRNEVGKVYPIS